MQESALSCIPFPNWGWFGLALVGIFWPASWLIPGMRTHWAFFPLWLGYCLLVDALAFKRRGTSLLSRSRLGYAGLFLASAPAWWLFELINKRTQNWIYLGRDEFGPWEYFLLASLSFSTVMPAVFGTAELCGSFRIVSIFKFGPKLAPSSAAVAGLFITGIAMFSCAMAWPRYCFPFVWTSVFCLIEPVNTWLGYRTLFSDTAKGDWWTFASLFSGCLVCGFFWEMWNFYSYPKWVYDVPFVGFFKIFEMPILGYGGYLPFALELFALYHLMTGLLFPGALKNSILPK